MKLIFFSLLIMVSNSLFSQNMANSSDTKCMLDMINYHRRVNKLKPLRYDSKLELAAFLQAYDNYLHNKGGHDNTNSAIKTPDMRIKYTGYQLNFWYHWSENVGRIYNYHQDVTSRDTVDDNLFDSWINSSSHNKNILHPNIRKMGIFTIKRGNDYYSVIVFAE
jgi:uncharacterized protein YkwD